MSARTRSIKLILVQSPGEIWSGRRGCACCGGDLLRGWKLRSASGMLSGAPIGRCIGVRPRGCNVRVGSNGGRCLVALLVCGLVE